MVVGSMVAAILSTLKPCQGLEGAAQSPELAGQLSDPTLIGRWRCRWPDRCPFRPDASSLAWELAPRI